MRWLRQVRMRRRDLLLAGVLAVLIGVTGVTAVGVLVVRNGAPVVGRFVAPHAVAGPIDGRDQARFSLLSGADAITVRAEDLGGDLYRARTDADSGVVPSADVDDEHVRLRLVEPPRPLVGPGVVTVEVRLSIRVRWSLRLTGGATDETIDLRGARLGGVEIVGGTNRLEVWLPAPDVPVTVRIAAGSSDVQLHLPDGVPAQVRTAAGAGGVTVDDMTRSGVPAGASWRTPGWDSASRRYDVNVVAGVGALTLDRR